MRKKFISSSVPEFSQSWFLIEIFSPKTRYHPYVIKNSGEKSDKPMRDYFRVVPFREMNNVLTRQPGRK